MKAEFTAFRTRLNGHALLAGKVDTAVRLTDGGEPVRANYVVATPSAPDTLDDARYLDGADPEATARYTNDVRVVAVDPDGVLLLADAVLAQLVGHTLTVMDRVCEPIELVPGVEEGRVMFDRTTRLHWLDMSFRFWSKRAVGVGSS